MIWFEWKKILNGRVLLCFVVIHLAFLMLFWTQNSSVQKGRNTAKQQEIILQSSRKYIKRSVAD